MLILTRYVGEVLRIGDDISVEVMRVDGYQARLGIAAPRHVPVHREEIYERIQQDALLSPKSAEHAGAPTTAMPLQAPSTGAADVSVIYRKRPKVPGRR